MNQCINAPYSFILCSPALIINLTSGRRDGQTQSDLHLGGDRQLKEDNPWLQIPIV